MSKTDQHDLLTGSLTAHIIRLSLPMIVAMLFQTGFSVIDMVFVGMVSPEAMAVLSIVFPVIFFFVSFAMGIGAGLTSFIARAFGAGDLDKAGRIAANGLAFSVVISVLLAGGGILFAKPVFVLLGAGPDILDSVLDYCRIIFIGFIFIFFEGNSQSRITIDHYLPEFIHRPDGLYETCVGLWFPRDRCLRHRRPDRKHCHSAGFGHVRCHPDDRRSKLWRREY